MMKRLPTAAIVAGFSLIVAIGAMFWLMSSGPQRERVSGSPTARLDTAGRHDRGVTLGLWSNRARAAARDRRQPYPATSQ